MKTTFVLLHWVTFLHLGKFFLDLFAVLSTYNNQPKISLKLVQNRLCMTSDNFGALGRFYKLFCAPTPIFYRLR